MAMTVDELIAHEEIRQAIYRHFRSADRMDVALDRTAIWDDAYCEGGPFEGPAGEHMPALIGEALRDLFTVTMHYMANMIIKVRGNEGFVEIYALAFHVVPPTALETVFGPQRAADLDPGQPHEFHAGIRYSLKMECRDGEWKIAVMKLIFDWTRIAPYTEWTAGGVMDNLTLRGRRDRSDPSYVFMS